LGTRGLEVGGVGCGARTGNVDGGGAVARADREEGDPTRHVEERGKQRMQAWETPDEDKLV